VQCNTNTDCAAASPLCHVASHTCVACLANSDCGTTAPICDQRTFMCRAGCTSNAQCTTTGMTVCDTTASRCVQCAQASDCSGMTPFCEANRCVQCTVGLTPDAGAGCPAGMTCRLGACR
jgi:hypothetical protein